MKSFLWIIASLSLLFTACQSGSSDQKASQTPEPGTASPTAETSGGGVSTYTPEGEEAARIRDNVAKGLLGDSTQFPYVYQGEGRSLIYQAWSMSFSLTAPRGMVARLNPQVPWVDPSAYNENNGIFATYVRNGRELSLNNPYIQVQYIHKQLKNCSTVDSIYLWMDNFALANRSARVVERRHSVETQAGQTAVCKAYYTGPADQPPGPAPKYIAYAYVDYNDEYWLGFGLTTMNEDDFKLALPDFYELVKSMNYAGM